MKIGGIGLLVQDMEKMVAFYRDVLRFEAVWDGGLFASFKTKDAVLFMYDRKAFAESLALPYAAPDGVNIAMEILFDVPDFADVDEMFDRLKGAGVRMLSNPVTYPWGQRSFFFADPEGNVMEIGAFEAGKAL